MKGMMGGNPFYSNAEAYAFEILQQKLLKEAQRSAQQTVMELSAFRTLFNQGQFIYCIPVGGLGLGSTFPFSCSPPLLPSICPPQPCDLNFNLPLPPPPSPPNTPCPPAPPNTSPCPPLPPNTPTCPPAPLPPPALPLPHSNQQSILHVNVKNNLPKTCNIKPGSDECNLGEAGIEVTIDLREYLPAEISLDVEEKSVEVKACHVDPQGSKTFARRYDLPACIILDSVKCILTYDGYLLFSAAWIKME